MPTKNETLRTLIKPRIFRMLHKFYMILGPMLGSIAFSTWALSQNSIEEFSQLEKQVWLGKDSSFADSEKKIVKALQKEPFSSKYHYLLAHLFVRSYAASPTNMELLKKASDLAQQAVDLSPEEEYGYIVIAEVLDMMGQTSNALKILSRDTNPNLKPGWRTWFLSAKLKSDRESNSNVLKLLEKSMRHDDSQWDIVAPYVIAVIKSGSNEKKIETELSTWDQRFPSNIFKESRALSLARQGKFYKAHEIFTQIYTTNVERVDSILNDAIILHTHMSEPKKASILLSNILNKLSGESSNKTVTLAHAHLGAIHLKSNRLKPASDHFIKAISLADNRFETLEFVTQSYRSLKKYKSFALLLEDLNRRLPGSGVLYALLGETLSEDLNEHNKALDSFSNAISLEPRRSDFYNGMGLTYYRQNQLDKALNVFYRASRVDPEDAIARYNIACILSRQNRQQEAIVALREAISLDPRLIDNARKDRDFDNIKFTRSFSSILKSSTSSELSH